MVGRNFRENLPSGNARACLVRARLLSAAGNQVLGDLAKATGALTVTRQFAIGTLGEFLRECARLVDAKQRRISRFFLRLILAGGFAQRHRRFFDIQKVVDDLKSPANRLTESAEALHVFVMRTAGESTSDY